MNLRKVSMKVLARRAPSSRNSVQFSLKIFWELQPRMWPKKLFQASYHLKVVSVFLLKSKTSASKTTFKDQPMAPQATHLSVKTPTLKAAVRTILKWISISKTVQVDQVIKCSSNLPTKASETRVKCPSRGSKVPPWTSGCNVASLESTMMMVLTASMMKSITSTMAIRGTWVPRECHQSAGLKIEKSELLISEMSLFTNKLTSNTKIYDNTIYHSTMIKENIIL